jgi:vacuolar protein sorting-associated protein 29
MKFVTNFPDRYVMVLVLVLGDVEIPRRCVDIPPKFKKLLVPGKIQHMILTGNIGSHEMIDFLRTVCPDMQGAKGDMEEFLTLPGGRAVQDTQTLQIGAFRIGVVHGHQILPRGDPQAFSILARKLDVDVLISGNSHKFEAFEYHGRFFVSPGSITGAFHVLEPDVTPSFVLMDVQNTLIVMYVYHIIEGEIKVEKLEFTKKLSD